MVVRGTLQWALFLLLALAAGGVGTAYWLWTRSDDLLREQIEAALAEALPGWSVTFEQARFDPDGEILLTNLALVLPDQRRPLLHVPELTVALDRRLLAEHQRVVVRNVRITEPSVLLVRDARGRWNWQDVPFPTPRSEVAPEIEILGGVIVVQASGTEMLPAAELHCREISVRLVPSGRRRYALQAATDVERAGPVQLEGTIDLNTGEWRLRGTARRIDTGDGLLDVAAGLSRGFRDQVAVLSAEEAGSPGRVEPADFLPDAAPAVQPAGHRAVEGAPRVSVPSLGLHANLDLEFTAGRAGFESPLDYALVLDFHGGRITNAALPVPLHDLAGRLRVSSTEVVFEDLSAANGESRLFVSGRLERTGEFPVRDLTVRATNLALDREVRDYLTPRQRELYDTLSPAGLFNIDVHVATGRDGAWHWNLREFTALDCTVVHELFQYPVTGIRGTIRQEGDVFRVELAGHAAERPLRLTGHLKDPGPDLEVQLRVHPVQDFPIDRKFLDALRHPRERQVREALETLHLAGLADFEAEFTRQAGPGQKVLMRLDALVHNAVLQYERFPYQLANLRGRVRYNPAERDAWRFEELRGEHGPAVVSGEGEFDLTQPPGRLALRLTAVGAPIDADLHVACLTASPELDQVWQELNPSGVIDAHDVAVTWVPGQAPEIVFPSLQMADGRVTPAALPYRWERVTGRFAWAGGRLTIHSLSGFHGEAYVQIDGSTPSSAAWFEHQPRANVAWRLHVEDLRVRRLVADDPLRHALPAGIAEVVAALDPQGPLDLDLSLDLKGATHSTELVTAHWWMRVRLQGNRLDAGVQLDDVWGNVEIVDGVWDGNAVTADGFVTIASLRAFDIPFQRIHGPFTVDGERITFGAPAWHDWLRAPPRHTEHNPYAGQQLQAEDVYAAEGHEGRLGLDGVVVLDPHDPARTRYRVDMKLQSASLREWANQQGLRKERLSGSVNAEATILGQGPSERAIRGGGWVQISPAQLYELPVMARVFSEVQFKLPDGQPPDNAAFKYAYSDFTLEDGLFRFSEMALFGDAINLVGWGRASFAQEAPGRLELHFLSRMRNQIPILNALPILSQTVDALTQGWVHVIVTGTVDQPEARIEPRIPVVSDAISGVMQMIEIEKGPTAAGGRPAFPPRRPRPFAPLAPAAPPR